MENDEKREMPEPIWCVAANVVLERSYGPGGEEKRRGTKHFRVGAKVICVRFHSGPVWVVGRHRASNRYVLMTIRVDHLTNWRVELVYSPRIIDLVRAYVAENQLVYPRLDGSGEAKAIAEEIAEQRRVWSKSQEYVSTRSSRLGEVEGEN